MCPVANYFTLLLLLLTSTTAIAQRVERREALSIGGIRQWVQTKGDTTKPLLLFLHGGPGNSVMAYAERFSRQLEQDFLVVHWDQREGGETKKMNASDRSLTAELFEEDAIALIGLLLNRYGQSKIFLAGHSWGGFLALAVANKRPDLLHSCIAISPMIHQNESEKLALTQMMTEAKERNNAKALADLQKIKIPFETADDLYLHRKWLALLAKRKAPEYDFVKAWADTWLPVFQQAARVNLFEDAPRLQCPAFFIVGDRDYQCNFQLTKKYADNLVAPDKELFLIAGAGHSIPSAEPDQLQAILLQIKKRISN